VAVATLGVLLAVAWQASGADVLRVERSFHGVLRVQERDEPGAPSVVRDLLHGTTLHGMQYTSDAHAATPLGYYARSSGAGLLLTATERAQGRRVGLVGLGIGTLTAFAHPADTWRYYELDPVVTRLARDMFTFLDAARARVAIVHGDARVSLEREPPQRFDVLVLDAFSGDAVPTHMLTREAFALYLRHLAPRGAMAIHAANRHLDLLPVVLAAADGFGLQSVVIPGSTAEDAHVTDWVLLSRGGEAFAHPDILLRAGAKPERRELWTDEWTSVWRVLK
jgi:predicted O-methyltransferase YrrM